MRTNLIAVILFLAGMAVSSPRADAQQRIDQLITRVEGMNNVNTNVVINKNKETGAIERIVKTVTIMSNKNLISEFQAAFDQEKNKAYQVSENSTASDRQLTYRFAAGNREISCTLKIMGGSNATVTYIDRDANESQFKFFLNGFSSLDTASLQMNMEDLGRRMEDWAKDFEPQMEQFGKQMEQWGEEFGKKMEEAGKQIESKINSEERFFRGLPAE